MTVTGHKSRTHVALVQRLRERIYLKQLHSTPALTWGEQICKWFREDEPMTLLKPPKPVIRKCYTQALCVVCHEYYDEGFGCRCAQLLPPVEVPQEKVYYVELAD